MLICCTATPITQNFSLSLGRVEIQVPNVTAGSDYQIVCKYTFIKKYDKSLISL